MIALAIVADPSPLPARYDAMCRAIDAAYEIDEVKNIRDKALAWETYSRQAKNIEAERRACEVRLRAERRAGELLKQIDRAKRGDGASQTMSGRPTLSELGVTRDQSSNWQRLAGVPKDQFEAAIADPDQKPTTAGIIRAATEPKREPVSADALWLWGRLKDFERNGLLAKEPPAVLLTMTPGMLDDVHTLAPRVIAWLRRIGRAE